MNQEVKKYFEAQPKLQKETLEKVRKVIQKAAPDAVEIMSYGVPAFKFARILLGNATPRKEVLIKGFNLFLS